MEDLTATSEEGLFAPELDPNFPEIIYLHGIMGGHLANHYGAGERVWLNPLALVAGNVAERMTLGADGLSEIDERYMLGPDGISGLSTPRQRGSGEKPGSLYTKWPTTGENRLALPLTSSMAKSNS